MLVWVWRPPNFAPTCLPALEKVLRVGSVRAQPGASRTQQHASPYFGPREWEHCRRVSGCQSGAGRFDRSGRRAAALASTPRWPRCSSLERARGARLSRLAGQA
eukprot:357048-Chlamydomonas_euryale.AAC.3